MYRTLFENLTSTDVVLTINKRLYQVLHHEYACFQKTLNYQAWEQPTILHITSWLQNCWGKSLNTEEAQPLLLSPLQERVLWQTIIQDSKNHVLHIHEAAQLAQKAWQLCQQWQINYAAATFSYTEDTKAWQHWALTFEAICKKNQWIDIHQLPNRLIKIFEQTSVPQRIFLIGFSEINPQYSNLFQTLQKKGCSVIQETPSSLSSIPEEFQQLSRRASVRTRGVYMDIHEHVHTEAQHPQMLKDEEYTCYQLALDDDESELQAMAQWSYQIWKQGETKIACVVPNLTEIRSKVASTFYEVFRDNYPFKSRHTPYNISAGCSLKTYPIIYAALSILALHEPCETMQLSYLLRSPYLGHAKQEMTKRAQLDFRLRSEHEPWITLQTSATEAKKNHCLLLAQALEKFISCIQDKPTEALPQTWSLYFSKQLIALGWPGEQALDSAEFQLIKKWSALLDEFSNLDLIVGKIDQATALRYLNQLAIDTIFQPESSTEAPIQILGVLETTGLHFNQLWVMGVNDTTWPAAIQPNPFIPYDLQHQAGTPHSSNQRELDFSQLQIEQLCHSAKQVIFSYAQQKNDVPLYPSKLIAAVQHIQIASLNLQTHHSYQEKIFYSRETEFFEDEQAPVVKQNENLLGSTSIFKKQAACAFQAFAHLRLHAKKVNSSHHGLNKQEQGQLLHSALEALWKIISTQEQLLHYDAETLENIINQAVEKALLIFSKKKPFTFKTSFIKLEQARLQRLLNSYLEQEKKRPSFAISCIEKTSYYDLANLSLKLRIDRIDATEDAHQLIIDYKTGRASLTPQHWLGNRPDSPQLPLYCLAHQPHVKALLFVQINSDAVQFKGMSAEETHIKGVIPLSQVKIKEDAAPTTWDELLQYWEKVMEKLAQQFQAGDAAINPKYGEATCRQCDLHTLCRINENYE